MIFFNISTRLSVILIGKVDGALVPILITSIWGIFLSSFIINSSILSLTKRASPPESKTSLSQYVLLYSRFLPLIPLLFLFYLFLPLIFFLYNVYSTYHIDQLLKKELYLDIYVLNLLQGNQLLQIKDQICLLHFIQVL